jgi:hypothetical protein
MDSSLIGKDGRPKGHFKSVGEVMEEQYKIRHRSQVLMLIDAYLAHRVVNGPEYKALAHALAEYGPVEHHGRVWRWSRGQNSIVRMGDGR